MNTSFNRLLKIFLTACISGVFCFNVSAQSLQQGLSLKEAINYALENQINVKNALLDEQIAKKKVDEITGLGLPQINSTGEVTDYLERPTQLLPGEFFGFPGKIAVKFGTPYNMTLSASASQLIFDGTYLVGLQAAKTYKELAKKSVAMSKRDVAVNVTKAYYGVQVAQNRLNILDANLERLRKSHSDAQVMYENGFIEKIDVDRLKVTLNNLETEKQKVISLISLSNNLLKFQMGMPVDVELRLTDSLRATDIGNLANANVDYNNRVEFQLLESQQQLNILDMRRHKVGYLPSLAAFGNISTQAQRDEFNFLNNGRWYASALIGARLTLPIFDGFQKSARIQQARMEVMKTENSIANLKNAIDMETKNALVQYRNNYQTMLSSKENLELAQEVVRVTQIKYQQGVGSNLEVITAESSLKEAQTNYFSALYDLMISKVDLDKAKGELIFE